MSSLPGARHARQSRRGPLRAVLVFVASAAAVLGVSAVAVAGSITVDVAAKVSENVWDLGDPLEAANLPAIGELEGGVNMMIVGSDSRGGENARFGSESSQLNDVNILVHISEDQDNVVVVSFPRDLIVPLPSCERSDGTFSGTSSATALNNAMYYGGMGTNDADGMNCVVTTIENLTGLEIPYAAMIDFQGVIDMSDAIGGVDICVAGGDLYDPDSKVYRDGGGYGGVPLSLTEGPHTISGGTALAYLRSRHGVGDGSDLGRISSQQAYLSSLIRKVKDDGVLTDLPTLYQLANAAVSNMKLSSSIANPNTMIGLAKILSGIDLDKIAFVQYPGSTGSKEFPGKVVPNYTAATVLFDAIKDDKAIKPGADGVGSAHTGTVDDDDESSGSGSGSGSKDDDSVEIAGVTGQLANEVTCSVANN